MGGFNAVRAVSGRIDIVKAVKVSVHPAEIRRVLLSAAAVPEIARLLKPPDWGLAMRITGDRELHRLNSRFLGEDHATDVLSFPSGDGKPHLGDIVISWPATQRQAEEFGHPASTELALLSVHGLLHLLGLDHVGSREENEMNRLTVMALAETGHRLPPGRLALADA
jgi:probable rRNA maturation factor